MKIKKTEPKNKNLYYKWFDNTGEYDIWYKKPTMIFHYKEDKIPMELKSFLDKWYNKMENYKIDYVENYPVKLAKIEFIYKDVVYAIYPTTIKATYTTSFLNDSPYEASWDSLFEYYQKEIRDDMEKELGVIHSRYYGFLD